MALKFLFEWRTALLTVLLLPTLISLGFWQLRRASENHALILNAENKRQQIAVALSQLPDIDPKLQFKQVVVQGLWLDKTFLLENQTHEGRNGYHVIGVIKLEDGRYVLVNRGWIQAPALRSELPSIPSVQNATVEHGEIYLPSQLSSDGSVFAEPGWPRRIGKLSLPGLERELGIKVMPVMVRLREGSPSALVTQWSIVNIDPDKNLAYAVQWFGMAIALVIFYLALAFRREKPLIKQG